MMLTLYYSLLSVMSKKAMHMPPFKNVNAFLSKSANHCLSLQCVVIILLAEDLALILMASD